MSNYRNLKNLSISIQNELNFQRKKNENPSGPIRTKKLRSGLLQQYFESSFTFLSKLVQKKQSISSYSFRLMVLKASN